MSNFTVYKHISPSGKVYIGITRQRPEARWGNGKGYKHSPHLQAAIQKYGWNAFAHEILATGLTKEEAERREIELIAEFKSTDRRFGYNADKGGSAPGRMSEETKRKIGESNRTRVWTSQSRQKLREYKLSHPTTPVTARKIGEANRGRKHRAESIEKIRKAQKKTPVKNLSSGISYQSVNEAASACDLDPSHIVAVCRGRRKTTGGAVWCYEEVIA